MYSLCIEIFLFQNIRVNTVFHSILSRNVLSLKLMYVFLCINLVKYISLKGTVI